MNDTMMILASHLPETVTTLVTMIGVIFSMLAALTSLWLTKIKNNTVKKQDMASKINDIAKTLSESSDMLTDIETELQKRIDKVNNLKEEAEQAEQIISLTQDQVQAIQSSINKELKKDSRKSFWSGVVVNFVFFVLGALVSFLISRFFAAQVPVQ